MANMAVPPAASPVQKLKAINWRWIIPGINDSDVRNVPVCPGDPPGSGTCCLLVCFFKDFP